MFWRCFDFLKICTRMLYVYMPFNAPLNFRSGLFTLGSDYEAACALGMVHVIQVPLGQEVKFLRMVHVTAF